MKKLLSIFLVLCMLCSLAACGGTPAEGDSGAQDSAAASDEGAGASEASDASKETAGEEADKPAPSGGAFDEYTRPVVKDTLKVGYMIRTPDAESHIRSYQQAEIEAAHRGWTLVPGFYETDTNFRDYFNNLVNQGVDAIIVGSVDTYETKQELVDMARDMGIGIYSNDTQVIPGVISNCTMPNGVAAMEIMWKVCEDYSWNLGVGTMTYNTIQSDRMRMYPVMAIVDGIWPNVTHLCHEELSSYGSNDLQAAYDFTQAWLQQYGDELDLVVTGADYWSISIAEAIMQMGDTEGDECFTIGFDGGSQAWSYIRNHTPLRYSYAQPFEYFTHNVFEIIDQIQVQGLNPGDEGCLIDYVGQTVYSTGAVVTRDNVPAVGSNIHEFFNYYDPEDTDAWYNWTDGPGIYTVTEYIG